MRFPQTRKIVEFLRRQNRMVRPNNQKISEWVDEYIDRCIVFGEAVTLVSQWCISKDLEERYRQQEEKFIPTKKEKRIFETEMPRIISAFISSGIRVSWWITFNRSYLDSGRIDKGLEDAYKKMIGDLAEPLMKAGILLLVDWEDEVLGQRPQANEEVLGGIERFVTPGAFKLELERHSRWVQEEAGLRQSDEEIRQDVCFQIACEVEEGRLLDGPDSPFGDFILVPLEVPERYDFFAILAKDFKLRIASVLPTYPWRL